MKLEKVRKLRVGDIVVGAKQISSEYLSEGLFYEVFVVEPDGYEGHLPVRVRSLGVDGRVTRWPFHHEIAHRLPRPGEKVRVISQEYMSIPKGTVTKVKSIAFTSDGTRPIIKLCPAGENWTLNFRPEWVARVKKVKVKDEVE